jgi:type VI secretion system secreted protein Hcp
MDMHSREPVRSVDLEDDDEPSAGPRLLVQGSCSKSSGDAGGRAVAIDIFAKLGDIEGESLDSKHKDEIEVLSWSWGVTNAVTLAGSGAGQGRASFHDLSFTHKIDKASPVLMQACATGVHLKEATITHRKAGKGQQEFLVIKMNDVIVTAIMDAESREGDSAESVSLAFAKIDVAYRPAKADGSLDAGIHFKYDLKANKEA